MEAVLGAVYLERGLPGAAAVVHRLFDPLIAAVVQDDSATDWKTALQELSAAGGHGVPEYVLAETGPDHAKRFTARVLIGGRLLGEGGGGSKKEAEQIAARLAALALGMVR